MDDPAQVYGEEGNTSIMECTTVDEGVSDDEVVVRPYITFDTEEPDDYTDGLPRMVDANDGVKNCVALLMTLTLSDAIKRAIKAQRGYAKAEAKAERELDETHSLERKLRSEISNHDYRLCMIEEDPTTSDAEQKEALEQVLAVLKLMMENCKVNRLSIDAQLRTNATFWRAKQAKVNEWLEDAFVEAQLLESEAEEPDVPVKEVDLQHEYQEFCAQLQESGGHGIFPVAPLDTRREHLEVAPLSPEEQAKADLHKVCWDAQQRLQSAQAHFDNRERDRQEELQIYLEGQRRGTTTICATQEDFDLLWLKREQELTHKLVEAEEKYKEARTAAIDAGVDLGEDHQESVSVDDADDGYQLSFEQEQNVPRPSPKVNDWLEKVSGPASPSFNDRVEQAEDLEVDDLVTGDSVSVIAEGTAEGTKRTRIDKWRQVCGF
ncbi:hypothetical protein LTR37_008765 [Vermiconidia calcicola]|uniref:Uncharacterized protein n=1 Tax=Vermiconidia calcicola TaxID=1690605 RepID=A0ACC3NBK6_9PEZI|nr:hypothetical protein LTR37_008765 [Vermiconidia calcicola]